MTSTTSGRRGYAAALLLTASLVGGCAVRTAVPVAVVTAVPPPAVPRPTLPAGVPERLNVPIRDADGRYRTINFALGPEQVAWHVRSALNVAVLSCRGPGEAVIAADYNALLHRQKATLAAAYARVQAGYRISGGTGWQASQDAHSTRVYNFFALPPAKPGFCAAATRILADSRTVDPAGFAAFAAAALPVLEQPFTDLYRAHDRYRQDLAAWESRQPGMKQTAQAAPASAAMPVATMAATMAAPTPRAVTALPRLEYVGIDRLIDWQPRGPERMAAIR